MINQPSDRAKAVSDVSGALRQALSVNPQLLYEAAANLSSQLMLEALEAKLVPEPNAKQIDCIQYRGSVCLWLARFLIQSGRADLTEADHANAVFVRHLLATENAGKRR